MATIKNFHDLQVWQKAHELVLLVYEVTSTFPTHELYGLVSQMRRAAISVASNIVEGFRRHSVNDSIHFYNISEGSLEELKYQLLVSRDLHYISDETYTRAHFLAEEVSKLLYSWKVSQRENTK
ncbi:four helix bundle protein [Candidatus Uhrbacteria bacterium]|nr:four helix bundle protein [Candidatus Uhrbacteria bacterium]